MDDDGLEESWNANRYLLAEGHHNEDDVQTYFWSDDINYDCSGLIHGSDNATNYKIVWIRQHCWKNEKVWKHYFGGEEYKMFMKNNQRKTCWSIWHYDQHNWAVNVYTKL